MKDNTLEKMILRKIENVLFQKLRKG